VARILMELELVSMEDGSEHELSYFRDELKEFFEQFGWKLLRTDQDEDEEDTDGM